MTGERPQAGEGEMEERATVDSRAWLRWVSATCVGASLAVLLCVVLYKIRLVFVPFAAGFVVAYIFDPLLDRLETRGWSRRRAVWTVMALLVSVTALLFVLLVPQVVGEVVDAWQNRALYSARAGRFYDDARTRAEGWLGQYESYLPGGKTPSELLDDELAELEAAAGKHWPRVLTWLGARTVQAFGMIVLLLFGTLVAFHFMLVIDPLRDGVKRLFLSERQSQEVDDIVERVNRMLGAYVRGMAAVSILVAVATALGLWGAGLYFGTRYALVLGLLAGVTYAVPWVGQVVSAGGAFFFGLVTADHHAFLAAVVCAVVVIAINQICDNAVMPRIVGGQVGLHPLAVLFAIMAGFQLFGLVGMIAAVPVAGAIRIAMRRWIPTLPEHDEKKAGGLPALDMARVTDAVGHAIRRFAAPFRQEPDAADAKPASDKPTGGGS